MSSGLTKAQRLKMVEVNRDTLPDYTGKGAYIWGRHEMRVCNRLRDLGLITIGVNGYAHITPAGRQALKEPTNTTEETK